MALSINNILKRPVVPGTGTQVDDGGCFCDTSIWRR